MILKLRRHLLPARKLRGSDLRPPGGLGVIGILPVRGLSVVDLRPSCGHSRVRRNNAACKRYGAKVGIAKRRGLFNRHQTADIGPARRLRVVNNAPRHA